MHPVVIKNASGKPSIYWCPSRTEKYEGINQADVVAMEDFLEEWITSGRFNYLHQWQEGDFIMWVRASCSRLAAQFLLVLFLSV
jgi:alpha-ketoglutarate-dependent taurine dioxygenase